MRIWPLLCLSLIAAPLAAKDEIYRWVDAEGVIHYSSRPPSKDAQPATLPDLQTYRSGSAPSVLATPAVAPAVKPATGGALRIEVSAPVPDETFRDPQGLVPVSVAVAPGLPDGARFVFYLDGVAQTPGGWTTPSYTFTEVVRGEHSLIVAVQSAEGVELARSAPVRFHQKPPIARP